MQDSLFEIIWRRKLWLIICAALAVGIAWAYLSVTPKIYTATSKVLVQRLSTNLAQTADHNAPDADDSYLGTQCEVLRSTQIIAAALGSLDADSLKSFEETSRPSAYLKRKLTAEVGKKDKIITVGFSSPYPKETVEIVDAVVHAYQSYQDASARKGATNILEILGKQKQGALDDLNKVQQSQLELRKKANVLEFNSERDNYVRTRLARLSDELTQAHLATMQTREALETACKSVGLDPDETDPQNETVALGNQDEELLRAELFAAKQRLGEQRRSYGASHPRVKEQAGRVAQLERAYVGAARARWRVSVAREREIDATFQTEKSQAIEQSAIAARYAQLEAQEKRLTLQIEQLDEQSRQIALAANAGALSVSVLEPAQYEDNAVGPNRRNILAGAALMGILAGCGFGLLREWIDPRIRSAAELKSSLGLPMLGAIPVVAGNRSRQALGWTVHLDPNSESAESYRSLRTSIQFGSGGSKVRTILVTSATPGDGKSTLSSNLAIALAEGGRRVLLVDGDLRNPSQALIFGLSGAVGFSSVLSAGEMVDGAIRRTTVTNLHVMPAGPIAGNPSELLNSPALHETLELLGDRYDHVVVDSPPIGRADDARILAASVDGAILVVRADKSNRRHVEDARDAMLSVGARVLGAVLNWSRSGALGGYGYGYGYGYGHASVGGADSSAPAEDRTQTMAEPGNGAARHVEPKPRRSISGAGSTSGKRVLADIDDGLESAPEAM